MKQIGSATTTLLGEAVSGIGTPRGERGSATQAVLDRSAAWLARKSPREVDEAIQSLASSHGVTLTVDRSYHIPRDEHGNPKEWVFTVKGAVAKGPKEECANLHRRLINTLAPAPSRQIEAWLAELSVIVARRSDDEFTETLRIEAYAARLARYPADIVREALLGRTWRFWPAWAEIEPLCEAATAGRRAMIAALERRANEEPTTYAVCARTAEEEAQRRAEVEARRQRANEVLREAGFLDDAEAAE